MKERVVHDGGMFALLLLPVLLSLLGITISLYAECRNLLNEAEIAAGSMKLRRAARNDLIKRFAILENQPPKKQTSACLSSTEKVGMLQSAEKLCVLWPRVLPHGINESKGAFVELPFYDFETVFKDARPCGNGDAPLRLSRFPRQPASVIARTSCTTAHRTSNFLAIEGNLILLASESPLHAPEHLAVTGALHSEGVRISLESSTIIAGGDIAIGEIHSDNPGAKLTLFSATGAISVERYPATLRLQTIARVSLSVDGSSSSVEGLDLPLLPPEALALQ